jgi:hypothetical protein
MCGTKDWFFDLDETFRQSVKLGDNSRMMAMGKRICQASYKWINSGDNRSLFYT